MHNSDASIEENESIHSFFLFKLLESHLFLHPSTNSAVIIFIVAGQMLSPIECRYIYHIYWYKGTSQWITIEITPTIVNYGSQVKLEGSNVMMPVSVLCIVYKGVLAKWEHGHTWKFSRTNFGEKKLMEISFFYWFEIIYGPRVIRLRFWLLSSIIAGYSWQTPFMESWISEIMDIEVCGSQPTFFLNNYSLQG